MTSYPTRSRCWAILNSASHTCPLLLSPRISSFAIISLTRSPTSIDSLSFASTPASIRRNLYVCAIECPALMAGRPIMTSITTSIVMFGSASKYLAKINSRPPINTTPSIMALRTDEILHCQYLDKAVDGLRNAPSARKYSSFPLCPINNQKN